MSTEYFFYTCPHCRNQTNAVQVAANLPEEILVAEAGRRNGRRQRRRHAGPGRPSVVRCPGCSTEMSSAELREHRVECVHKKLQEVPRLPGFRIRLTPKDPDPYPDFYFNEIRETEVEFKKGSNSDHITVDLNKIAEITIDHESRVAHIRVLGHITWCEDIKRWRFAPSQIGRPPLNATIARNPLR